MLSTLRNSSAARRAACSIVARSLATGTDMGAYKHNYDAIIEQRAIAAKQELATLAEAFMRYDGDGNGHLDRQELEAALADLEVPAGEVDVDNLFKSLPKVSDAGPRACQFVKHEI